MTVMASRLRLTKLSKSNKESQGKGPSRHLNQEPPNFRQEIFSDQPKMQSATNRHSAVCTQARHKQTKGGRHTVVSLRLLGQLRHAHHLPPLLHLLLLLPLDWWRFLYSALSSAPPLLCLHNLYLPKKEWATLPFLFYLWDLFLLMVSPAYVLAFG
jgi:hypothetical protein